jgi:hypothetical protein
LGGAGRDVLSGAPAMPEEFPELQSFCNRHKPPATEIETTNNYRSNPWQTVRQNAVFLAVNDSEALMGYCLTPYCQEKAFYEDSAVREYCGV